MGAVVVSLVPLASGRALPEAAQIIGPFLIALTGLVLVEQLYRNTTPERRWSVKHLCLGLGGVFAYDLYLYADGRSEEHTSELQSLRHLVCRLLLEKKKTDTG